MLKRMSVAMVAMVAAAVLCGCATGPKGPTPEEQVSQALAGYIAAAQAKDVDKLMTFVDDEFASDEWPDKEAYGAFVRESLDMGYLDDMQASTENTKILVEGDEAVAAPVELTAAFGSATLEVTFSEEDGKWLVSDVDMEMY